MNNATLSKSGKSKSLNGNVESVDSFEENAIKSAFLKDNSKEGKSVVAKSVIGSSVVSKETLKSTLYSYSPESEFEDVYGIAFFLNPWLSFYNHWLKTVSERENAMRRFIRHPSDIPIAYSLGEANAHAERLKDVSRGGLCFNANHPMEIGSTIDIEINLDEVPFEAKGTVAWCRREKDVYSVGIEFSDTSTNFSVRMVEQICHIEHYRTHIIETEGRVLSSEEAAREWVEKYAAEFPQGS
jgi:hypothetical protein